VHQVLWPLFGHRSTTPVPVCRNIRGSTRPSLHTEGRAVDYFLRAEKPGDAAVADALIGWLLAPDVGGVPHAWARRLGVQEVIWNRHIWSSGSHHASGMRPYSGENPHTDHVHIGMNWPGARIQTSFWTGCGPALPAPAVPVAGGSPAPSPPAPSPSPGPDAPLPEREAPGTVLHRDKSRHVVYAAEVRSGGTRAWRNNNPGNIEAGQFTRAHGAIGSDGRFAVFPDEATGMAAIVALLRTDRYIHLTVADAITRYAPPNENDTTAYVAALAKRTGIAPTTMLDTLDDAGLRQVALAIRHIEGWHAGTVQTCSTGPDWVRRALGC